MMRKTDIFDHYGSEEFMVILPETNGKYGRIVAEKIRQEIEEIEFSENLKLIISLGVAEYTQGRSADRLIESADAFLYIANENGRSHVEGIP